MALHEAAGKKPAHVKKDVPGFIGNRLQHALWREAISLVEHGICDAETVDAVIKASFGRRIAVLGPLENADLVGTDLTLAIHETVLPAIESRPAPSPYLQKLVDRRQARLQIRRGLSQVERRRAGGAARQGFRSTSRRRGISNPRPPGPRLRAPECKLVGRVGWGSGGDVRVSTPACHLSTPTPNPSPQGGGESQAHASRAAPASPRREQSDRAQRIHRASCRRTRIARPRNCSRSRQAASRAAPAPLRASRRCLGRAPSAARIRAGRGCVCARPRSRGR